MDLDRLGGIQLFIEEENAGMTDEMVRAKFGDLVS